ncbi:hypothetical protein AX279_19610 [Pseudomonas sp. J237]|nr:hypothetical protein AX279_19610 [Pseudomonas sp. J237]
MEKNSWIKIARSKTKLLSAKIWSATGIPRATAYAAFLLGRRGYFFFAAIAKSSPLLLCTVAVISMYWSRYRHDPSTLALVLFVVSSLYLGLLTGDHLFTTYRDIKKGDWHQ